MRLFKSIKITDSGKTIILQRSDGSKLRFHATWLRDNALDSKTRDANSGQRLITLSEIPINTYIESATLDESGKNIFLSFLPEKKKNFIFCKLAGRTCLRYEAKQYKRLDHF